MRLLSYSLVSCAHFIKHFKDFVDYLMQRTQWVVSAESSLDVAQYICCHCVHHGTSTPKAGKKEQINGSQWKYALQTAFKHSPNQTAWKHMHFETYQPNSVIILPSITTMINHPHHSFNTEPVPLWESQLPPESWVLHQCTSKLCWLQLVLVSCWIKSWTDQL